MVSFKEVIVKGVILTTTIAGAFLGLNTLSHNMSESLNDVSSSRIDKIQESVADRSYDAANTINLRYRLTDKGQAQIGTDFENTLITEQTRINAENKQILEDALKTQQANMSLLLSATFLVASLLSVALMRVMEYKVESKPERLRLSGEGEKMDLVEAVSKMKLQLEMLDGVIMDATLANKK